MIRCLGLCATLALLGCAGNSADAPPPASATTVVIAAGVSTRDPTPRPKPIQRYTDDQIIALLTTFNAGQVDLANIVRERGHDARVRTFARVLHDDHEAALRQELALQVPRVALPPTERMRAIRGAAAAEAARLKQLEGHDLDAEFLSSQVTMQRDALDMIDATLVPNARRAEVRAHLRDFRDRVDRHARDASALGHDIGGPILAR